MGQALTTLWEPGTLGLGGGSLIFMATPGPARLSLVPKESKSFFLRSRARMGESGPLCPELRERGTVRDLSGAVGREDPDLLGVKAPSGYKQKVGTCIREGRRASFS